MTSGGLAPAKREYARCAKKQAAHPALIGSNGVGAATGCATGTSAHATGRSGGLR